MVDAPRHLGPFLRAARERAHLSLRSVEGATAISNAYLSQLERGMIRQPSPVVLHKLSKLYGVSYAEAMRQAGYPVPGDEGDDVPPPRALSRFGEITEEEEAELADYLEFIRARRRRARR